MIQVKEALDTILKEIKPLPAEETDILSALERVLAEDVFAQRPNPPWDNSAMDGYALISSDISNAADHAPARLKVIYDLPAGSVPKGPVKNGTAVRIMTGAPVPDGADAVVMVENTEKGPDGTVLIRVKSRPGENIRRSGEDFKAGELVVRKGSLIRPAEVAMLATVGRAKVKVHKRPVAAIVSTGDELVDIDEAPSMGKITNSNGYTLSSLVREAGAEPLHLGIAMDTKEALLEKLREALAADCIITSGGVSVGDYDFVKDVLKEMGSEMIFWKVAIKPGKPLAFGVIGSKPAFGLPGNPISSMVSFEQFVRPALMKMAGRKNIYRRVLAASITADLRIKPGRMNFIRAELSMGKEGFTVTPLEGQGSGMILSMVKANSFIIVPADSSGYRKGDTVEAEPFDAGILADDEARY